MFPSSQLFYFVALYLFTCLFLFFHSLFSLPVLHALLYLHSSVHPLTSFCSLTCPFLFLFPFIVFVITSCHYLLSFECSSIIIILTYSFQFDLAFILVFIILFFCSHIMLRFVALFAIIIISITIICVLFILTSKLACFFVASTRARSHFSHTSSFHLLLNCSLFLISPFRIVVNHSHLRIVTPSKCTREHAVCIWMYERHECRMNDCQRCYWRITHTRNTQNVKMKCTGTRAQESK